MGGDFRGIVHDSIATLYERWLFCTSHEEYSIVVGYARVDYASVFEDAVSDDEEFENMMKVVTHSSSFQQP